MLFLSDTLHLSKQRPIESQLIFDRLTLAPYVTFFTISKAVSFHKWLGNVSPNVPKIKTKINGVKKIRIFVVDISVTSSFMRF